MNQADVSKLVSQLRIRINPRHRNMKTAEGPAGRLRKLRKTVTALFKYERIELNYTAADEARGYAERLIGDAIRFGDCHNPTMKMCTYWLEERQLIHKLFKVLVPRYKYQPLSFTSLYRAPKLYEKSVVYPRSVLELKGNPFPPLVFDNSRNRYFIQNVLMEEARKEYRAEKYNKIAEKIASSEKEQSDEGNNALESEVDKAKSKAAEQVIEDEHLLKVTDIKSAHMEEEYDNKSPQPTPLI